MNSEEDFLLGLVTKVRHPVFTEVYLKKARDCIREGDTKFALLALNRILEIDPKNADALRLIGECRRKEVPGAKVVIKIVKQVVEIARQKVTEIIRIGDLVEGASFFNVTSVPLAVLSQRTAEEENIEQLESKVLEGKDYTVTLTPHHNGLKFTVTISSDHFPVKSLEAVLKREATVLQGEIVQDTSFLKEIVYSVPAGESTLEISDKRDAKG